MLKRLRSAAGKPGGVLAWPNQPALDSTLAELEQLHQEKGRLSEQLSAKAQEPDGRRRQAEQNEIRGRSETNAVRIEAVQARIAALERGRADWEASRPAPPAQPPTITGVQAEGGVAVLEFSGGGEDATWFRAQSADGALSVEGPSSPLVLEGLHSGYPHAFTVQAENSAGPGPWSAPTDPVVPGVISAVSPCDGPVAGGTEVLIVGSALCLGADGAADDVRVTLDGAPARVVRASETAIEVVAGPGEPSVGRGDVVVHSYRLGERVLESAFAYHAPGCITAIQQPDAGDGGVVCVLGTDLGDGSDVLEVVVNEQPARILSQSASHVLVSLAAGGSPSLTLDVEVHSASRGVAHNRNKVRFDAAAFFQSFATPWTDDAASANCTNPTCQQPFTLCNRRHHCRRCGGLFCDTCTAKRMRVTTMLGAPPGAERLCDNCVALEEAAQGSRADIPGAADLGRGIELLDDHEGGPLSCRVRLLESILRETQPDSARQPLRGPSGRGNTLWAPPGVVADAAQLRRHWVLPADRAGAAAASAEVLSARDLERVVTQRLEEGAAHVVFTVQHEVARLRVDGVARLAEGFDPLVRARFGVGYVQSVFVGGWLELQFSVGAADMPAVALRATGGVPPSSAAADSWAAVVDAVHAWLASVDELQQPAVVRYGTKHYVTQRAAGALDAAAEEWAVRACVELRPALRRGAPADEDAVARVEASSAELRRVVAAVDVGAGHGADLRRHASVRELTHLLDHSVCALLDLVGALAALGDVAPRAAAEPLARLRADLERWRDALTAQQEAAQIRRTSTLFSAHADHLAAALLEALAEVRAAVLAERSAGVRRALPRLLPAAALMASPPTFFFLLAPRTPGQELGAGVPARLVPLCCYGLHAARCGASATAVDIADSGDFVAAAPVATKLSGAVVLGALREGLPLPVSSLSASDSGDLDPDDEVEAQATIAESMVLAANAHLSPAQRGALSDLEDLQDDAEAWEVALGVAAAGAVAARDRIEAEAPVVDLSPLSGVDDGRVTSVWVCPLHMNEWLGRAWEG